MPVAVIASFLEVIASLLNSLRRFSIYCVFSNRNCVFLQNKEYRPRNKKTSSLSLSK